MKHYIGNRNHCTDNAEFVFQRTAKKCTKNYNARAQPLFCSLNLCLATFPFVSWFSPKLPIVTFLRDAGHNH